MISQKGKNIALSNFTESTPQKITHVNYEWPKTTSQWTRMEIKKKNISKTEIGIEFKYILNSDPLALTGRNKRMAVFEIQMFF